MWQAWYYTDCLKIIICCHSLLYVLLFYLCVYSVVSNGYVKKATEQTNSSHYGIIIIFSKCFIYCHIVSSQYILYIVLEVYVTKTPKTSGFGGVYF